MKVIAWTTLSGEVVQKIIGVYICKKYPDATAIRPSQGDKGIDVRIDHEDGTLTVFQIKKFAQTLSSGQKRQIKDSWDTLVKYIKEEGKQLREWHLVMPLDPTNENLTWLNEMTAGAGCKTVWDGLAIVEGWAAEMPEVAEYYLFNGQERAQENFERALSIMRAQSAKNTEAIKTSLKDICGLLDNLDPNYSYSIHVFSKLDSTGVDVRELLELPDVVLSEEYFLPDGTRIRIDVLPKYQLAPAIEPITFTVTLLPESEDEKNQVERFNKLGVPLERIPAQLKGINKAIPFIEVDPNQTGLVYSLPHQNADPSLEVCLSTGADGLILYEKMFTRGDFGMRWEGHDSSGIMSIVLEAHIDGKWTISFKFLAEEEQRPLNHEAQRVFSFLNSWMLLKQASLMIDGKHTASIPFDEFGIDQKFIECGFELSNALAIIDSASLEEVVFPKMSSLTNRDVSNIKLNAELIENATQELPFNELEFEYSREFCPVDAPCILTVIQELKTEVGEKVYRCGYFEAVIPVGAAAKKDNGKTALIATEEYGNTYIRRAVLVQPSNLDCVNQIFGRKVRDVSEWLSFKKNYLEQEPISTNA